MGLTYLLQNNFELDSAFLHPYSSRAFKPSATIQYVEWDLRALNVNMNKDGHTITIRGLPIDS
jgi:hypothetical protein